MADDKSVQSFLILFCVGCIVSYGSCAPIEEKIVLDNGTVLTMVIHDVKEAPPRHIESALDASNTDEAANPNIVIHEAKYPPTPRVMSKRSADDDTVDDPTLNKKNGEPIFAPPPRSDSEKKLSEVSHPGAVEAAVQSTTGVPKPDEHGDNAVRETKKVTEPSKSELVLPEKAVNQPDRDAEDDKADEEGDDEEQKATTPIALPTKPADKVDVVKSNDDSKDGSDDQQDTKLPGEELGSTPSGELNRNIKSTTEKIDEVADNRAPGNDEQKNKAIATQPSVKTSSDDGSDDDDPTSEKGDDDGNDDDGDGEDKDNKSSSNANGDGKIGGDEGEDAEDDYDGEDDDANSKPNADKNATFEGKEDDDAEDDDDHDDDGKLLVDDDDKGKTLLKPLSGENSESEGSNSLKKTISDEPQSSGHFMSYFLIAVVFVACFYLIFHNRQKIKAYVLEGKTGRGRRRKAGNSEYRQLSTADEVLPDTDKGIESKTTYTY